MIAFIVLVACDQGFEHRSLLPYENSFGPGDDLWAPQPHRDHPLEVAALGQKAWVTLQGNPDEPGHEVAVVDFEHDRVDKVEVGSSPTGVAVHPSGELVLVLNRFSNWASVLDTRTDRVVEEIPTDFYAIEAVFSQDGRDVWVTNRWRDVVSVWELAPDDKGLHVIDKQDVRVGANPRDVAISPDGHTVAVASITSLDISLIDAATRTERVRIDVGAPPNGIAFAGDWLYVATTSRSTMHLPLDGPDGDGDGHPGDGTPNVNFQDIQNEIAVYRVADGEEVWRYTSDSLCCRDFRDVDPDNLELHGDLLPPRDQWIVGGALPEQLVAVEEDGTTTLYVGYSASNQVQAFDVDTTTGALTAGVVGPTEAHNPHGLAVLGDDLLIVARLGERLEVHDRASLDLRESIVVGEVADGEFPATDAELGELFNSVTAPFTVDGDQACVSCHREGGNIDKAISMPLTRYPGVGLRMVMAYRGASDTRPWFFESAMDETNFRPVINEFVRIENFCCSDYTMWPNGAPADCDTNPPPECAERLNPSSPDGFDVAEPGPYSHPRPTTAPTRDAFFLDVAGSLIGRTTTFGDSLYYEDLETGQKAPLLLNFDGITRALGVFLLTDTGLLPNPNDASTASVARGKALFERADVGCASCHPAPTFTIGDDYNPAALPVRMGPVVTPHRDELGINLDLVTDGFVATFPSVEVDSCTDVCGEDECSVDASTCDDLRDMRFGVPQLRGIWDRAPSMLHHGKAQGIREVLCTPGHPALSSSEVGFNERDGVPDTHGATSHLSPQDISDLMAYLETL